MLRFLTAGESHGPELVAVIEGVPAGFEIDLARINHRPRAPPERLRPRRPDADRKGRGSPRLRHPLRPHDGQPGHLHHRQSRLQKLGKADVRRPGRSRRGQGRHAAAPRPRRSCRRPQVQPRGYSRHARTRVRARNYRARRYRRIGDGSCSPRSESTCLATSSVSARPRPRLRARSEFEELRAHHRGITGARRRRRPPSTRLSRKSTRARKPATLSAGSSRLSRPACPSGSAATSNGIASLTDASRMRCSACRRSKGVEFGTGFEAATRARLANCTTRSATTRARGASRVQSNNSGGTEGGMSTGEPLRGAGCVQAAVDPDASAASRSISGPRRKRSARSSAPTYARFPPRR